MGPYESSCYPLHSEAMEKVTQAVDAQAVRRIGWRASGKQLLSTGPLKANRKIHRDTQALRMDFQARETAEQSLCITKIQIA